MSKVKHSQGASEARGEIVLYQTEDGTVKVECRFEDETIWMTQQMIADLFQTTVPNISMHMRNIYEEGELKPEGTVKKSLKVRQEGDRNVRRELDFFNLKTRSTRPDSHGKAIRQPLTDLKCCLEHFESGSRSEGSGESRRPGGGCGSAPHLPMNWQ